MEKVLREYKIEVVISTVGGESVLDQFNLIEAIKNVDTVKVRICSIKTTFILYVVAAATCFVFVALITKFWKHLLHA